MRYLYLHRLTDFVFWVTNISVCTYVFHICVRGIAHTSKLRIYTYDLCVCTFDLSVSVHVYKRHCYQGGGGVKEEWEEWEERERG